MHFLNNFEDNDEDDDEFNENQEHYFSKEAFIILIDNSKNMFQKELNKDSAFQMSLKCAWTIMRNKIIDNDRNIFSIVLYGSTMAKSMAFENIHVIHDLGLPSAKKIMQFEKDFENECADYKKYASESLMCLSDALWACTNLFSDRKHQNYYKRIYLFTNDDMPYGNNKEKKRQLTSRISDLQQNNIDLILMHINKDNKLFDIYLQYKDLLLIDDDDISEYPTASDDVDQLISRINYNNSKNRKMGKIPLIIRDDLQITVAIYNPYFSRHKALPIKLYKSTNEDVTINTRTFLKSNCQLLGPQDLKKSQNFLDKKICFEKDEILVMKNTLKPGIYLIGFLHKSLVKTFKHLQISKFIYPEESMIKGSCVFFTALLERMLFAENVAICKFIPNKHHEPSLVALFPQDGKYDTSNIQLMPPGFNLIYIPFIDDIRKINLEPSVPRTVGDAELDKAKELIKKLQFVFNCDTFENPLLQKHYADIEAIALERDTSCKFKDYTDTDENNIEMRVGQLVEEFKSFYEHCRSDKSNKRKHESDATISNKCTKFDGSLDDIKQIVIDEKLNVYTIPVLKDMLKILKIKNASTRKTDIISAIDSHFK